MGQVGFFLLLWLIVGFVVALVVGKVLREANTRNDKPSIRVLTTSLAIALLLVSAPAGSQSWSEAGLEVDNYKAVRLRIGDLSGLAKEFLTERRIRNHIESRLRSVGLTPDAGPDAYLYINVTVLPIEIGTRITGLNYMVSLDFRRALDFKAGGQTFRFVRPTWYAAPFIGVSTKADVAATVLKTLDTQVGAFLNEYLKTNQK